MTSYNKEVGDRLKIIRMIFNEGSKLSANQFAYLLDETGDKIRNYELGRASIPITLLKKLSERGINLQYLVSGDGNLFNDSDEGKRLATSIVKKIKTSKDVELLYLKKEPELIKKIGM